MSTAAANTSPPDVDLAAAASGTVQPEAAGQPCEQARPARPERAQLKFTGTGSEYFRIWIVHTLLTLLTLGVYSPWAKVRKMRWFARHTRLLDDSFDYHGKALRILCGRLIALLLLVAYSYAFDFSVPVTLGILTGLLLLAPLLFVNAQRFRLANTSWRGLRFGFTARRIRVYAVCVPIVLIWTGASIWTALEGSASGLLWIGAGTYLAWPAMHALLKALQHQGATFGGQHFGFEASIRAFYGFYGRFFALGIGAILTGSFLIGIVVAVLQAADVVEEAEASFGVGIMYGVVMLTILLIIAWPYFAARLQKLVWSRTHYGQVRFHGEMSAGTLMSLVWRNMLLVLLTAGLYWPFAAVAIARYRIESVVIESHDSLQDLHAHAVARDPGAVGDGATDFFDLDLGW